MEKEKNKKNKSFTLTSEIMSMDLPLMAKFLLALIYSRQSDYRGWCSLTVEEITDILRVKKSQFYHYRKMLVNRHLVETWYVYKSEIKSLGLPSKIVLHGTTLGRKNTKPDDEKPEKNIPEKGGVTPENRNEFCCLSTNNNIIYLKEDIYHIRDSASASPLSIYPFSNHLSSPSTPPPVPKKSNRSKKSKPSLSPLTNYLLEIRKKRLPEESTRDDEKYANYWNKTVCQLMEEYESTPDEMEGIITKSFMSDYWKWGCEKPDGFRKNFKSIRNQWLCDNLSPEAKRDKEWCEKLKSYWPDQFSSLIIDNKYVKIGKWEMRYGTADLRLNVCNKFLFTLESVNNEIVKKETPRKMDVGWCKLTEKDQLQSPMTSPPSLESQYDDEDPWENMERYENELGGICYRKRGSGKEGTTPNPLCPAIGGWNAEVGGEKLTTIHEKAISLTANSFLEKIRVNGRLSGYD